MSGHSNGLSRNMFRAEYDPSIDDYRDLADRYRDDVSCDALSLYYTEGIIDSDQIKLRIQEAIEIAEQHYKPDVRGLRAFLVYVTEIGERGPVEGWNER